jgi:hypothetical protein
MSSCELAKEFGCQQRSTWLWKAKAMESSGKYALAVDVEVDEFLVEGFSAGKLVEVKAVKIWLCWP